ncbi:hypothetical protein [Candidatus Uabimicrobium amorphum]|uniref:Uncharacterized protein n=1 Tax=Uabimicrobium amorphum TaxID=2596890 RepID=A0A5S9IRU4_UABAM|nr:hypothetical protein [Candidatus Uabimicrobium amorphum]BBM86380.1 hypothetical protein UABAM_04766 [Candidatus Uabimicrobium amorphum]
MFGKLKTKKNCPFCKKELSKKNGGPLYGETGGMLHREEYQCVDCKAEIVKTVINKLGQRKIDWSIRSLPICKEDFSQHPKIKKYLCPHCKNDLLCCIPLNYKIEQDQDISPSEKKKSVKFDRNIPFICSNCDVQLLRCENGDIRKPVVDCWRILQKAEMENVQMENSIIVEEKVIRKSFLSTLFK